MSQHQSLLSLRTLLQSHTRTRIRWTRTSLLPRFSGTRHVGSFRPLSEYSWSIPRPKPIYRGSRNNPQGRAQNPISMSSGGFTTGGIRRFGSPQVYGAYVQCPPRWIKKNRESSEPVWPRPSPHHHQCSAGGFFETPQRWMVSKQSATAGTKLFATQAEPCSFGPSRRWVFIAFSAYGKGGLPPASQS